MLRHHEDLQQDHSSDNKRLPEVYFIIPLLREQSRVHLLVDEFVQHANVNSGFKLVLVTTERETEDNRGNFDGTTAEVVKKIIYDLPSEYKSRVLHLHYPTRNKVVAEQLNFAVNSLGFSERNIYFCFYNADGQKDKKTYDAINSAAMSGIPIVQQSSLFVKNIPDLACRGRYLEAAFGLYQSSWTVQHEISRYTIVRKSVSWLPNWIDSHTLAHCVMHGLLIRSDVLRECNGIPNLLLGGEDIALGFILRCNGYHIEPLSVLENSETPSSIKSLWVQLSWWFVALTGYASFNKLLIKKTQNSKVIAQQFLGLWDMSKWLLKGPVIITYLAISISTSHIGLGLFLYLFYIYSSLFYILCLWKNSARLLAPPPNILRLIPSIMIYPLIPILRSIPAVSGLFLLAGITAGIISEKPKTE